MSGDTIDRALKGNRQYGDILIALWEIKLDLSRKFYPISCHLFILEEKILFSNKINTKKRGDIPKWKWFVFIAFMAILICLSFELLSDLLLRKVGLLAAVIILICIILIGVLFDIIGIAVTAASEVPFHSKASKKIPGAKTALKLIKNADKVATICNDVVGDICGIVSGSVGAMLVTKIVLVSKDTNLTMLTVGIGTVIGTFTILGKSFGKSLAMENSEYIVFKVAKILYYLKRER